MKNFIQCAKCGKVFAQSEAGQTLCSACSSSASGHISEDEMLSRCRNYLRDADATGKLVDIDEVAESTGISAEKIWEFINGGFISTLSFDDPKVRAYLLKKEQERERELGKELLAKKPADEHKGSSGFHSKDR
jgi:predicted  nucleic acid-binding Zn-ribbon protein